jgi:hypothetical protein
MLAFAVPQHLRTLWTERLKYVLCQVEQFANQSSPAGARVHRISHGGLSSEIAAGILVK